MTSKIPQKGQSLADLYPEIAAQADGWDPTTVSYGSHLSADWKCGLGHSWNAIVKNRVKHRSGCPVCSGRKAFSGFNDLATTHPELAAQANGWDTTSITSRSSQKVSWKCHLGHVWNAAPNTRSKGHGCPMCSGHMAITGVNDLATTHPELAAQAVGWDPSILSAGSGKKLDWRCQSGHVWSTSPATRSSGHGCPMCSGHMAITGVNDLATTHPELAAQAVGWDPSILSAGSNKKVAWSCALGHVWESQVVNRSMGGGCPFCGRKKVLAGFNDLATTHPELAAQADGWDPTQILAGSGQKRNWLCSFGHQWTSGIASRASGVGCPICVGAKVLAGFNDLATTHPELAAQADGWDPTTLNQGSDKKVSWRCENNHRWDAAVGSRSNGNGCPICVNQRVLVGYNDLATTKPELAAQAYGWDPTTLTAKAGKSVGWICKQGHTWQTVVANRSNGSGCPVCSGHQVLAGYNDLATTNPELAAQAHGWDPATLVAGSDKRVEWRCGLGHTWTAPVSDRSQGRGCAICSNKEVLVGYNDLATTNPELAAQADGWDPSTLTAGSSKRVGWRCRQGHTWKTKVSHRSDGIGCPSCAISGFDPNKDGWLYFIDNDELSMFQVGISNVPDSRLNQHSKRGWEVKEVRGPMKGQLVQELETAILHAVERRGAILGHKAGIEKFDGYSEAWTKDSLQVSGFKQLLDWVYEDDQPGK